MNLGLDLNVTSKRGLLEDALNGIRNNHSDANPHFDDIRQLNADQSVQHKVSVEGGILNGHSALSSPLSFFLVQVRMKKLICINFIMFF